MTIQSKSSPGFSLFELLTSMTVLSILLVMLMGALSAVSSMYINSDVKVQAEERGRAILELFSREVTPAVVDTRMQFVMMPGDLLTGVGAEHIALASPAVLWMAPLGESGELRCVGYYLTRDPELNHYRLKRIFIRARGGNNQPHQYFPRLLNEVNVRDLTTRTSATDARWFTRDWDEDAFDDISDPNEKLVVSTVSEGVIGFWVRALDTMGNPIPLLSQSTHHPKSDLMFNSSAYFYMADGTAFDNDETFVYLKKNRLTMKANRIPSVLEVVFVMLADDYIDQGAIIPEIENILDSKGALDMKLSLSTFLKTLNDAGIKDSEVFQSKVKLANGG